MVTVTTYRKRYANIRGLIWMYFELCVTWTGKSFCYSIKLYMQTGIANTYIIKTSLVTVSFIKFQKESLLLDTTVAEISDARPVFYIALYPCTNPLHHTSSYNDIHTILITCVPWIIIMWLWWADATESYMQGPRTGKCCKLKVQCFCCSSVYWNMLYTRRVTYGQSFLIFP